ncbi:MAG: excinuclease ABC subunit UvrC [Spirochaetia bacterium]
MKKNLTDKVAKLERIKALILDMPTLCGVYLWKSINSTPLYIGKAINIRSRLMNYLNDESPKVLALLDTVDTIDCIIVKTEYEALLLENNLIKEYSPRYNIQLKDQKTYPLIRITKETYPRIFKTRQKIEDGSIYYGPYPDAQRVDNYLKIISKIFKLRECKAIPLRKRKEPCIYYHMHQCWAPCCKDVDPIKYQNEVQEVSKLLAGNIQEFLANLTRKMDIASQEKNYEQAARYRDAIHALKLVEEKPIVEDHNNIARDYLAYAGTQWNYRFVILPMRYGKMLQKASLRVETASNDHEVLEEFLLRYYGNMPKEALPRVIYMEHLPQASALELFFKEQMNVEIKLKMPIEAQDLSLIRMAFNNATLDVAHDSHREGALEDLQHALSLPKIPKRIEGFDIAQLSGYFTVASLVSFLDGMPDYNNYRTFRMRSLQEGEIDDYKSLSEAVARRFSRLKNENLPLPDLIIIDGGKGQLSAVLSVLEALDLSKKIALISIAKREEEIFMPNKSDPILLKKGSPALRLCQAVRDETHRVATSHNKKLRSGILSLQQLEAIEGIGPKRAKKLMIQYGSLQAISHQEPTNIAHVAKISIDLAQKLIEKLQNNSDRS